MRAARWRSGVLTIAWTKVFPLRRNPRCQASARRRQRPRAKQDGYTVRLYYVGLDTPEESLARIANRVKRGGHNIGTEDVLRRFAGRWEAVSKVLPYCDEAHFFDNDNGFVEVAEYKNGELLLVGDLRPAWVLELQRYLLRAESAKEGDAE